MGQRQSIPFTDSELKDYQDLTYLTKKEILFVFEKFKALDPVVVQGNKNARLPAEIVMMLPELNANDKGEKVKSHTIRIYYVNPFRDRICKVFSSSYDDTISFEDFLDMMSVFSSRAPKRVKAEYAFRIYDFDEDDVISEQDLRKLISHLTSWESRKLTEEEMEKLIDCIFSECDMDEDNCLSFSEFEHVLSKSRDFTNSFRIRL